MQVKSDSLIRFVTTIRKHGNIENAIYETRKRITYAFVPK